MAVVVAEALHKPDMPAVIARTHITGDIHGLLLPIFEAISNAVHGIEQRFPDTAAMAGRVSIDFQNPSVPEKLLISVCDNGAGLNDENYLSFLTPFSGQKLSKKGRGFGRFIAFKVFNRILYSSNYTKQSGEGTRTFRFNIFDDREIIHFDGAPDFSGPGVCVEFNELKPEWHPLLSELSGVAIADEIAHHFFPEFLQGSLPKVRLRFGEEEIELTSRFSSIFRPHGDGKILVAIEGKEEQLEYTLSRVPKTRRFNQNSLLFSAAGRIVGNARDLSQKLGRTFFVGEADERYVIIAVVSGEPLEKRLNDSRTSIDIAPKVVEDIVSAIAKEDEKVEGAQIKIIKDAQRKELAEALTENPILRAGLTGQSLEEYVKAKPKAFIPLTHPRSYAIRLA